MTRPSQKFLQGRGALKNLSQKSRMLKVYSIIESSLQDQTEYRNRFFQTLTKVLALSERFSSFEGIKQN